MNVEVPFALRGLMAERGGDPVLGRHGSIQQDFERFHRDNPEVYETLVRLARQYRARLGVLPGIGMLWEVARWSLEMDTTTRGVYKLNNNLRSRYARLIMECEPDLADGFETRQLKAA